MHGVDGDLAAVAGVFADATTHLDGAAHLKSVGPGAARVPQDGRHAARAVGECEAQVGRAIALVASLDGAYEQEPVDERPVSHVRQ